MGNHYDPRDYEPPPLNKESKPMAHPHEMNEEPTKPNPYTPRKPVQQWKDATGRPYDTAIEAIESDLTAKTQEVHNRNTETIMRRRELKDDAFNANRLHNFRSAKVAASKAVRELEQLCIEYRQQLAEDEREAKR